MTTTTQTRPTDAELADLLRAYATDLCESGREDDFEYPEGAKMLARVRAAADALEATCPDCAGGAGMHETKCRAAAPVSEPTPTFEERVADALMSGERGEDLLSVVRDAHKAQHSIATVVAENARAIVRAAGVTQ